MRARKPKRSAARDTSAWLCRTSPLRASSKLGAGTGTPSAAAHSASSSSRVVRSPRPTLIGSPATTVYASAAARFAATTSATYTKSRDCSPSPKMRGRAPAQRAVTKSGITPAYIDFGSWRGPKTLK